MEAHNYDSNTVNYLKIICVWGQQFLFTKFFFGEKGEMEPSSITDCFFLEAPSESYDQGAAEEIG